MEENFEEITKLKMKLMHDIFTVVNKANNENKLQTPDIIGCLTIVWFDYLFQCQHNAIYGERDEDNKDRGFFI